jgi:hypothetical protein
MKKVAIMLDAWKLKIFKKHLDGASFSYKKHPGLTANTLTLKVETDDVPRLKTTVEAAQRECARARMH